jgi:hypothetical protein
VAAHCASRKLIAHYPPYDLSSPTFDLASELRQIREARCALVDLSFERPSSYYELGLIEALGQRAFVIAEEGTPLHQTSLRNDARFYSNLDEFEALVAFILDAAGAG